MQTDWFELGLRLLGLTTAAIVLYGARVEARNKDRAGPAGYGNGASPFAGIAEVIRVFLPIVIGCTRNP